MLTKNYLNPKGVTRLSSGIITVRSLAKVFCGSWKMLGSRNKET